MSGATVTLESLGLSQEDIAERVVELLTDKLLRDFYTDEDSRVRDGKPSAFGAAMKKRVIERIDKAIDDVAAKSVLPNVAQYVETLCIQETNTFGEKKGKELTFIEYLVLRAEHYLNEQVDHNGVSEQEARRKGNSWYGSSKQTRITHLVHQHLHYSIEEAMKTAVKEANTLIVGGIEATVKQKLAEVTSKLTVSVGTGR